MAIIKADGTIQFPDGLTLEKGDMVEFDEVKSKLEYLGADPGPVLQFKPIEGDLKGRFMTVELSYGSFIKKKETDESFEIIKSH